MTESVYDGDQTAADVLTGYTHYLRDEVLNLSDEEIKGLIKKLQKCVDNSRGPRQHKEKTKEKLCPALTVPYQSKSGMVFMLDDLEDQLRDINDDGLTSLQYELDMFREDFDDFLTPEQVEWVDRMHNTVSAEIDARWLLKKLEEHHIVRIERS